MSRGHTLVLAAPWALLFVYGILALYATPDPRGYGTHEQFGFGACLFRDWLGGPCPTCGVTTSATHLAHGDLSAAWVTQPLGVLMAAAAALGVPATLWLHRRGVDLGSGLMRHGRRAWSLLAVTVAACWLL